MKTNRNFINQSLLTLAVLSLSTVFCVSNSNAADWVLPTKPFSSKLTKQLEEKAASSNKKVFLLWDLESNAESYSSEIDNSFFFQFKSSGILKYQILDRLSLDLKANVLFQGGQAQSRFGDLLPSGPAYLSYGFLKYDVLGNNSLTLQAGALSQGEVFGSNVFISSNRSFPGVGESVNFEIDDFSFRISAQQVVPTTFTFSTALIERERTPTLNSGNASVQYEGDLFSFRATGGVFDYSNLPALVADTSRLFGNSVRGTGFASQFIYDYNGWTAGLETFYNPSKSTTLKFKANMLENVDAPKTYNQSQALTLSVDHRINQEMGMDMSVTDFFVESDAVPAFFTSRNFGQTNRRGYSFEAGVKWLEKKVRISAAYTISNLINPDPALRQLDNDIISINLETAYDLFN